MFLKHVLKTLQKKRTFFKKIPKDFSNYADVYYTMPSILMCPRRVFQSKRKANKPKHYQLLLLEFNDEADIDVLEQSIYDLDPKILALLLKDRTTKKNIIWACDSYVKEYGEAYRAECEILPHLLTPRDPRTGESKELIQPRTEKTKEEQKNRTRKKAEVFTPSWLCNEMNNNCDAEWFGRPNVFNTTQDKSWTPCEGKIAFPGGDKNWQKYVKTRYLEITCGEAPYLVSRYDTTTGEDLPIERRIGVLDRKLRVVNENTFTHSEWLEWVFRAYKSTYGFEFQGDNLLIARKNLYFTFLEYYYQRFGRYPSRKTINQIIEIITWNLWQMDGLKDCVPFSNTYAPFGKSEMQLDLFESLCTIMDWDNEKSFKYQDLKRGL